MRTGSCGAFRKCTPHSSIQSMPKNKQLALPILYSVVEMAENLNLVCFGHFKGGKSLSALSLSTNAHIMPESHTLYLFTLKCLRFQIKAP